MHAICDFNAFFYISKICFEFGRNGNYSQVSIVVFSSVREKSENSARPRRRTTTARLGSQWSGFSLTAAVAYY